MKKGLLFSFILFYGLLSQSQDFSFVFEEVERTYTVHLPTNYSKDTKLPMVLNLHGAGYTSVEQQFYTEMDSIANLENFVVVYPNGIGGIWNIFSDDSPNDVGFISTLIDTMDAKFNIDLERVYACGISLGGFMTYKLGCQLSNKIAAIGSVAGVLTYNDCTPGRAIPVCHFHGTIDSTVAYNFANVTVNFWKDMNACSDSLVTSLPDIDTTDQSTVSLTTYNECSEDVEVLFYTIEGGGHTWPGATFDFGPTTQDIHASVELWKFFSKYTLPDYSDLNDHSFTENEMKIYPNPVVESATIELKEGTSGEGKLRLFDLSGKVLWEKDLKSTNTTVFSRNNLKKGIYLLEYSAGKCIIREKLIIR